MADGRIPALDGIRGLAISLVLMWHGFCQILGAHPEHFWWSKLARLGMATWSGVDLFFVLSGFLIGGILLDVSDSPSYFQTFYVRRIYRILPLYAAVLLSAILIDLHYRGSTRPEWLGTEIVVPYYFLFLQNIWMGLHDDFGSPLLGVTWSLAVEEQFYLSLPLLIRYVSRRTLWRILAIAVVAAPVMRMVAMRYTHYGPMMSYVLLPCRADALCFGVAIALAIRTPAVWERIHAHRGYVYSSLAVVGLVTLSLPLERFTFFSTRWMGLEYSLFASFYCLLLVSTLLSPRLSAVFSFAPLRFMGIIAYGVYLLHEPIILGLRDLGIYLHPAHRWIVALIISTVAIPVSVGLATLSWEYFEKPFVKRGHHHQYERSARGHPTTA